MADFKQGQPAPQGRSATSRDAQDQGSFPDSCEACEAPKLGSESVANFSQGPGVPASRTKIH